MKELNLIFDEDTILKLTNEQFQQLIATRETITDFAPAREYWIDEDFSRLFLALNDASSDLYFEFEPEEDINTFVQNAYLTHFFPKTSKIKLINNYDQTLEKLLLNKLDDLDNILQIRKDDFPEKQKVFIHTLNQNAVDTLLKTGYMKGLVSCCECGIPGCSSEYIWAKNFTILISFKIESSELLEVCLYPFRLI